MRPTHPSPRRQLSRVFSTVIPLARRSVKNYRSIFHWTTDRLGVCPAGRVGRLSASRLLINKHQPFVFFSPSSFSSIPTWSIAWILACCHRFLFCRCVPLFFCSPTVLWRPNNHLFPTITIRLILRLTQPRVFSSNYLCRFPPAFLPSVR